MSYQGIFGKNPFLSFSLAGLIVTLHFHLSMTNISTTSSMVLKLNPSTHEQLLLHMTTCTKNTKLNRQKMP